MERRARGAAAALTGRLTRRYITGARSWTTRSATRWSRATWRCVSTRRRPRRWSYTSESGQASRRMPSSSNSKPGVQARTTTESGSTPSASSGKSHGRCRGTRTFCARSMEARGRISSACRRGARRRWRSNMIEVAGWAARRLGVRCSSAACTPYSTPDSSSRIDCRLNAPCSPSAVDSASNTHFRASE